MLPLPAGADGAASHAGVGGIAVHAASRLEDRQRLARIKVDEFGRRVKRRSTVPALIDERLRKSVAQLGEILAAAFRAFDFLLRPSHSPSVPPNVFSKPESLVPPVR